MSQDEAVSAEPTLCRPILKLKFERQLDRAGATDLVEWIESAVGAAGAQAAGQRLRRMAEQRVR